MDVERKSRIKIDVRIDRLEKFCKDNPRLWLAFIKEMPMEGVLVDVNEERKAELMEQLQNAIKEYKYLCDRKRKGLINEDRMTRLKEAGVGGALGYKSQIEDLTEKYKVVGLKGERRQDENYINKHKKRLKGYLYTLDMLYGGFDNFRKLYIQTLLDGKKFDVPKEFDGLFIENFDLDSSNFVNPLYNELYKDIRTLFKFDDEPIIGEIYNGDKINEAMSMLNYREQMIIRQRYGLDNDDELKYDDIAEKYSITIERARQVKEKAIMKLQMNTVYGRRLLANRDEDKRKQFITKYFENHNIFADSEERISEKEREELLGIIENKCDMEKNGITLPTKSTKRYDEPATVEKNDNKLSEEKQVSDSAPVITIKELGLNGRLYNILNRAGIKTTKDLENKSLKQFSKMRNMGEKTLQELLTKMDSLGIKTKDEEVVSEAEIDSPEQKRKPIEALKFSTRLYNVLDRAKIATIEDLSNTTVDEFKKIRDLGERTFDELMTKMDSFGIKPKPVEETNEELLRTIQKLSKAYEENNKKGVECQELKQNIFELLDKIDKNSSNSKDNSNIIESRNGIHDSYANMDK